MNSFSITRIVDATIEGSGAFIGLELDTLNHGPISIGLLPDAAHDITLIIRSLLAEGTNRGILPASLHPSTTGNVLVEAGPEAVHLSLDLTDGQVVEMSVSPEQAQSLGEKLIEAARQSGRQKPN